MANPKTRGRKSRRGLWMMAGLLIVGAAAAIGTILLVGDLKLPFLNRSVQAQTSKKEDHTGKVAVPILVRTIPAYTSVPMASLVDAKTNQVRVQWLDAEQVKAKGFITSVNDIVGRVMGRDKDPGYAFKEGDFLPKGTRPGPAAGIEPGMRGMSVNVDKVSGLRGLKRGDRFDLVAVKSATKSGSYGDKAQSTPAAVAAQADKQLWGASNKLLVQNGKIVVPFPIPGDEGARAKNAEAYIQVAESEADPLTEALAVGAQLICFVRSSRPGADGTPLPMSPPDVQADQPPIESIEVITAGKSETRIVEANKVDDSTSGHANETSSVQPDKKEPHK